MSYSLGNVRCYFACKFLKNAYERKAKCDYDYVRGLSTNYDCKKENIEVFKAILERDKLNCRCL